MKVKKSDVGRYCRVMYDDIGAKDGVLVAVDKKSPDCPLVFFFDGKLEDTNGAPIVALGAYITAVDFDFLV